MYSYHTTFFFSTSKHTSLKSLSYQRKIYFKIRLNNFKLSISKQLKAVRILSWINCEFLHTIVTFTFLRTNFLNKSVYLIYLYLPVWGCANNSNKMIIQRFQNTVFRYITEAPWFVRNDTVHYDLGCRNNNHTVHSQRENTTPTP